MAISDRNIGNEQAWIAENGDDISLPDNSPSRPPTDSALSLFRRYEKTLCHTEIRDPRGYRVCFEPEEFVHFVKLKDKHGNEPKNRALTINQIRRQRFHLKTGKHLNFSPKRVRDLVCAIALIQQPNYILPNWQPLGKANPGEVYIRDFGVGGRRGYRLLICGFAGKRRIAITLFHKERIADLDLSTNFGPKSEGAAQRRPVLTIFCPWFWV